MAATLLRNEERRYAGALTQEPPRLTRRLQGASNACNVVVRVLQRSDGVRISLIADQKGEALLRIASAAKKHSREHDEQNGRPVHSPFPRTQNSYPTLA